MSFENQIRNASKSQLLRNEPLARHTWYQIGGPCDWFCVPSDREEIMRVLELCRRESVAVFVLGKGSNLLVSDRGIRGLVLDLSAACGQTTFDGNMLDVGAGCYMPKVVLECEKHGLRGVERLAGIPGTVGGALKMNAGCHGLEIYDVVRDVTFIQQGLMRTLEKSEITYSYRHVATFDDSTTVILSSRWNLSPDAPDRLAEERKTFMKKRQATQPINLPSSGSVFKNPPGDHAARLIEAAGLKGVREGGAAISEKHSNFIVNVSDASATDVLSLMKMARKEVLKKFGVTLNLEVQLIGFEEDEIRELR